MGFNRMLFAWKVVQSSQDHAWLSVSKLSFSFMFPVECGMIIDDIHIFFFGCWLTHQMLFCHIVMNLGSSVSQNSKNDVGGLA